MYKLVCVLALILTPLAFSNTVYQVEKKRPLFIPITLNEDVYFRGEMTAQSPLLKVELVSANGKTIRMLGGNSQSIELMLLPEHSGEYQLKVSSQVKNQITLNWHKTVTQPAEHDKAKLQSAQLEAVRNAKNLSKAVGAFWQHVEKNGAPLVEYQKHNEALVTFVWRGAKRNVMLFGAPFGSHQALTNLPNTDIWYKSYLLPSDTLMTYQLAPDVPVVPNNRRASKIAILATKQRDPYNAQTWQYDGDDKFNTQSVLQLKDAIKSPHLKTTVSKSHTITQHQISSAILENRREISVYRHQDAKKNAPLLILFDGKAYQTKTPTPQILDNLIAAKKIPPINAVFVNNPSRQSRSAELPPNPKFAQFMALELRPKLYELGLTASAQDTILSGSSFGGLASMYVSFSYPEQFGKVLSQSGSFWWSPRNGSKLETEPQWLTRLIASSEAKNIKIYINAGLFETGYFTIDILESNRHLRDILTAKGYEFKHHEFSGGHDSYAWRNEIAAGLIYLLSI